MSADDWEKMEALVQHLRQRAKQLEAVLKASEMYRDDPGDHTWKRVLQAQHEART